MNGRERVRAALEHRPVDRVPKDLGGMRSTGISCFAHPGLRRALGLPYAAPRVYDSSQMLALPETDLLDALDCDVVTVELDGMTNTSADGDGWQPYDFGGRLPALVRDPTIYREGPDGAIMHAAGDEDWRMPPSSFVFDLLHGGEPVDFTVDPASPDPVTTKRALAARAVRDDDVLRLESRLRRVRDESDRAIFLGANLGTLGFPGGMAAWSMLCLLDPDAAAEHLSLLADAAVKNFRTVFSRVSGLADIVLVAADDQGTQQSTILSPDIFRSLYVPAYRRINDAIHGSDSRVKTFLHSCGAIYDILDCVVDAGFDVLNPVQWNAGGHPYSDWKAKTAGRIALWGGGVNTQSTLPLGSIEDLETEVRSISKVLAAGSGWVFCAIHNLLAEIPPEKIIALYRSV